MAKIKRILGIKNEPKTDFSAFFYGASSREKKKLMLEVVREANKDQKKILDRYDRMIKNA